MMVNTGVVVLNTLLLTALLILFGRMVRQMPTRFTWGLVLFAAALWLESAVQLYFFATMMPYYQGNVENLVLVQNVLVTLAVGFLTYVTYSPAGGRAPSKKAARA